MTRELYTGTDEALWPLDPWYSGIECGQPGCRERIDLNPVHCAAGLINQIHAHMATCVPYRAARADLHRQATRDGLYASSRRGGRPPALTPEQIRLIARARAQRPPVPVTQLARALGAAPTTVYRAVHRLRRYT